jgi:2-phospho-L-lactate guanylyltransferase
MNQQSQYGVIVPVKRPVHAKSRLAALGDGPRRRIAAAMAADTVAACLEAEDVALVLAVTDDHLLAAELRALGAETVPDATGHGLNETLHQSAVELARRAPQLRPVAVCADLPALRPEALSRALAAGREHDQAFVPDTEGVGTTLVTAATAAGFLPRFGPTSCARHLDGGAHLVDVPGLETLRRDVDTPEALREAAGLGLGPRTTAVLADLD